MISQDLDTKLDRALTEAQADPAAACKETNTEAAEMVRVAMRLRGLVPAPVPSLDKGRQRFLAEALREEREQPSVRERRLVPTFRPVFAVVTVVVAVILIGGTVFAAGSILAGMAATPTLQASTPTTNPSYTATPTQISLAPIAWKMLAYGSGPTLRAFPAPPPPNPPPVDAAFGPHSAR